jgi:SprA-related family
MSGIDGINNKNQLQPRNMLSLQPPSKGGPAAQPATNPGEGDGSRISGEAKKTPPSGERKDLLDGLKSNFGGNDRIQTGERKLEKLTTDQLKDVKRKREFDKALTKHEEAHHEVAADLARSGPLYETEVGADGETYRKSGKVMIDTGTEEDDDRTVKKMQQVRAAALAPDGNQLAPLSEQDKKVAASATEKERKAQTRLDKKGQGPSAPGTAEADKADKAKDQGKGSSF